MVHRPDLAHERLSPTNCHELLFDDVIWVRRARQEHDAFVDLMRERGVEVLLFHELLRETLEDPAAKEWLLSRRLRPEDVTAMFSDELTAWMTEMPAEELATRLTGGVTVRELPEDIASAVGRRSAADGFRPAAVAEPAVHARHELLAVRRRRDLDDVLAGAPEGDAQRRGDLPLPSALPRAAIWFGGADHDWGGATIEGGDVMPVGDGVVLVGHGERSNARGGEHPRRATCSAPGAARMVIGARMPRERAAMHLDTVFTFCDRDVATIYEPVVSQIVPIRYLPDGDGGVKAEVSDRPFVDEVQGRARADELTVVATGGDEFEAERNQWDDGNNVVALGAGRHRRLRAQRGHQLEALEGRGRGARDRRPGARPRPRRRPLHDLPRHPRRLKGGPDDHRHRSPRRRRRPARARTC